MEVEKGSRANSKKTQKLFKNFEGIKTKSGEDLAKGLQFLLNEKNKELLVRICLELPQEYVI